MRIPLLDGPSTPDGVERTLNTFGENPYREPKYRLIWSQRKQIFFAGEIVREYDYLEPCWILETWVSPEKDAGDLALWSPMQEALMGPYPRQGTYNFVQQFSVADEESLRLYCVGLEKSKDLTHKERKDAIKDGLEAKEQKSIETTAEAIVELQDSASRGKIQQGAGPKNNFRTVEDFERDQWKVPEIPNLPQRGGKIVRGA